MSLPSHGKLICSPESASGGTRGVLGGGWWPSPRDVRRGLSSPCTVGGCWRHRKHATSLVEAGGLPRAASEASRLPRAPLEVVALSSSIPACLSLKACVNCITSALSFFFSLYDLVLCKSSQYTTGKLHNSEWNIIEQRFERKLNWWKAKHLSYGVCLTLLNSVLSSPAMFMMPFFDIPSISSLN